MDGMPEYYVFQSTLPAWGATDYRPAPHQTLHISIHAPRMGSDSTQHQRGAMGTDFNPRSPHGERLNDIRKRQNVDDFNPRSPHGERRLSPSTASDTSYFNPRSPHGERRRELIVAALTEISIHAPRMGSDKFILCVKLAL